MSLKFKTGWLGVVIFTGLSGCVGSGSQIKRGPENSDNAAKTKLQSVSTANNNTPIEQGVVIVRPKNDRDGFDLCLNCEELPPTPKTLASGSDESVADKSRAHILVDGGDEDNGVESPMSAVRIKFASGSDEVDVPGKTLLTKAAAIARNKYTVNIVAKTDGSGPYAYNQKLAKSRADSVVRYLAARAVTVPKNVVVKLEPCCLHGRLPADADRRVVDVLVKKERS